MVLPTNFRKLWAASALSNLADGVRLTALPLLAATVTRDPSLVAGVVLANRLPWLLLALVGGAVADRVDRRWLMASMQAIRLLLVGGLAIAVAGGWHPLPLIYAVSFLFGVTEVLFDVSAQSIVPSIVGRDRLEEANGRLFATEIGANEFVGPPLGGALFAAARALPFASSAVAFGAAGLLVARLRGSFVPVRAASPTTVRADIREGVTWLVKHRLIRTMAIMVGVSNMMFSATFSIFVLFALERLGVSEVGFGLLMASIALGSVLGSLIAHRIANLLGLTVALIGSVHVMGLGLFGVGLTRSIPIIVALFIGMGVANMTWNVITVSLRQSLIPDRLLGRVNSVYRLLAWGTMPIGAGIGGLLASTLGLESPFLIGGVVNVVMGVLALPIVNTAEIERARAAVAV